MILAEMTEEESVSEELIEDEDVDEPWMEKHKTIVNMVTVVIYFCVGVLAGTFLEDWHMLTSMYVIVQIVTTIGYGDISITTEHMRWFMIFYVLFGIAIIANIVNDVTNAMLFWEAERVRAELRKSEIALKHKRQKTEGEPIKPPNKLRNRLIASFIVWLSIVLFWTVFYAEYEKCSCSYGRSAKDGCVDDTYDQCVAGGGQTKTFSQSFYMAIITMTTVGFGDFSPQTKIGRFIGLILMVLGVLATTNLITSMSAYQDGRRRKARELRQKHDDLFPAVDYNNSGTLGRAQFQLYMLLKLGKTSLEDLKQLDNIFNEMDHSGDGQISTEEVVECEQHLADLE